MNGRRDGLGETEVSFPDSLLIAFVVFAGSAIALYLCIALCDNETGGNHKPCPPSTYWQWFGWGGVVAPTALVILLGLGGVRLATVIGIVVATLTFWGIFVLFLWFS